MTVTVSINFPDAQPAPSTIVITDAALVRARLSFNPSGDPRVNRLKALAAAFYTELHEIMDAAPGERTCAHYEAIEASGHIQTGAMWAVSAATAHLVK